MWGAPPVGRARDQQPAVRPCGRLHTGAARGPQRGDDHLARGGAVPGGCRPQAGHRLRGGRSTGGARQHLRPRRTRRYRSATTTPLWWKSWPSPRRDDTSSDGPENPLLSGPLNPGDVDDLLGETSVSGVFRLDVRYFVGHPGQVVVRMPDVLAALRQIVDVVILEVPSYLSVHHGEGLTPLADVVLVVAEREMTTIDETRRTSATLKRLGAPVVGMALTDGPSRRATSGASIRNSSRQTRGGGRDTTERLPVVEPARCRSPHATRRRVRGPAPDSGGLSGSGRLVLRRTDAGLSAASRNRQGSEGPAALGPRWPAEHAMMAFLRVTSVPTTVSAGPAASAAPHCFSAGAATGTARLRDRRLTARDPYRPTAPNRRLKRLSAMALRAHHRGWRASRHRWAIRSRVNADFTPPAGRAPMAARRSGSSKSCPTAAAIAVTESSDDHPGVGRRRARWPPRARASTRPGGRSGRPR